MMHKGEGKVDGGGEMERSARTEQGTGGAKEFYRRSEMFGVEGEGKGGAGVRLRGW